jgi:hypothetical protein
LRKLGVVQRLIVAQQRRVGLHKEYGAICVPAERLFATIGVVMRYANDFHWAILEFLG